MPNICTSGIVITGPKSNVKKFCEHLVFEEDVYNDKLKKKIFARTWANMTRKEFMEMLDKEYKNKSFSCDVDCAWSVWSCMIEGYPQERKGCITLKEACKECKVEVHIESSEGGLCFSEVVDCNAKGKMNYKSITWPVYKCNKCGETQAEDPGLEPNECYHCEKEDVKWEKIKEAETDECITEMT